VTPPDRCGIEHALPLSEFRPLAADDDQLTVEERKTIIDTASDLLAEFYVHLDLKRAMHGADPLGRLRFLEQRLDLMRPRDFHDEMLSIFAELRDRHTIYHVPEPYRGRHAALAVRIQRCNTPAEPRFVITEVTAEWADAAVKGLEVTAFDKVPIARAVELNSRLRAGSNPDAYLARGLSLLTDRPLTFSPLPEKDSAVLEYKGADGQVHDLELEWQVYEPVPRPGAVSSREPVELLAYGLGVDRVTESLRRAQKTRFRPDQLYLEGRPRRAEPPDKIPGYGAPLTSPGLEGPSEDRLQFAQADDGVGYLRIQSFDVDNVAVFVFDVIRVLEWLRTDDGLIIDVRSNGGGAIAAGERLLQLFTPGDVTPERMNFAATDGTRRISSAPIGPTGAWKRSLDRAKKTGVEVSDSLPLSADHVVSCNEIGQLYDGPVVVIVDALTYSTAELFAAGIQDHKIGLILGTDGATGGGGGNPWELELLDTWAQPRRELPRKVSFSVAVRATTRVAEQAGAPVEDFGVTPFEVRRLTERDITGNNEDLIEAAVKLLGRSTTELQRRPGRQLTVPEPRFVNDEWLLSVEAREIAEVDVHVDGRPVAPRESISGGSAAISFNARPDRRHALRVLGYDDAGRLAASRRVRFGRGEAAGAMPQQAEARISEQEEKAMPEDKLEGRDNEEIGRLIEDEVDRAINDLRTRLQEVLTHEKLKDDRLEVTRRLQDALNSLESLGDLATNRWKDAATNRWFGGF
jgi:hypothetical protein